MRAAKYGLICAGCGEPVEASRCPDCPDALLRTDYAAKTFRPSAIGGIFRYADWLPPSGTFETPIGPSVYRSERLAESLGLQRLYIGFNGYAPEVGARNLTGSFKDFEALPTLLRFQEEGKDSVILASAGNTARAFAYAGTLLDFPIYAVVPEAMLDRCWLPVRASGAVRLIVLSASGDYAEAIRLASRLSERFELPPEGGARTVARRDGMGTSLLEFARQVGKLPRHYVQAVGSGTGAIAAWEASLRLLATGDFDEPLPALHLVQNAPFAPIHRAWSQDRPIGADEDLEDQLARISQIDAPVLANRTPPYAIPGGVRDALQATGGTTYAVTNAEIAEARALFMETEGLPISPEAGAAVAALRRAAGRSAIPPQESILLNVTGNNDELVRRDYEIRPIEPWLSLKMTDLGDGSLTRFADRFEKL